jgi:hypothetical protein
VTLRLAAKVALGIGGIVLAISAWNYATLMHPVAARLSQDARNAKVSLWAYHQYGLVPSVLVIDLRRVDDQAAAVDVLRALFQSAEGLKEDKFERVVLAHRGTAKLMMDGAHYRKIGQEFSSQNAVYTIRTLPENIYKLDGSAAYGTWTGGLLGVLSKQMEDVGKFSEDWYLRDLAEEARLRRQ